MANRGIAPFDPGTDIGRFRVRAGDTTWTELDPPEPGYGHYEKWSDAEIQVFLESPSLEWGIYEAYLQLATSAAIESREISDFDLKVSTSKRADQLFRIAQEWRDIAAGEDASAAEEAFEIVPTGLRHGGFIPEGTLPQWGRSYTWSRWR